MKTPTPTPTPTGGQEIKRFLTRIYNLGYCSGHNATVEGGAVHIAPQDMDTYHEDAVGEILEEAPAPDLLAENAALREEVERLENERAELWRQKREILSDRDTLNAACGSLRDSLTERDAELARLRDENAALGARNDALKAMCTELEIQRDSLRATNAGLVEAVESAFTEGYDAGYSNGGDDVSGFEHGSIKHQSVKEREKKQAWKDSEARAALDAAKRGEKE